MKKKSHSIPYDSKVKPTNPWRGDNALPLTTHYGCGVWPPISPPCEHAKYANENIESKRPGSGCEDCGKGFSLSMCLFCGHRGCDRHSSKHIEITGHPITVDLPKRQWKHCHVHEIVYR